MNLENRNILLGIDPSFINFGVCIYNPKDKSMNMRTSNMSDQIKWIQKNCKLKNCIAIVENPALNSNVFGMWAMVKSEIEKMMRSKGGKIDLRGRITMADVQSKFLIAMKQAQNVGENKAAAKDIIVKLRRAGVPVIEISPSKRDKAYTKMNGKILRKDVMYLKMPTKTTQAQFKKLTGYEGRSSEHSRDAATLVYGRSIQWAKKTAEIELIKRQKQPNRPATDNNNYFLVKGKEDVDIF